MEGKSNFDKPPSPSCSSLESTAVPANAAAAADKKAQMAAKKLRQKETRLRKQLAQADKDAKAESTSLNAYLNRQELVNIPDPLPAYAQLPVDESDAEDQKAKKAAKRLRQKEARLQFKLQLAQLAEAEAFAQAEAAKARKVKAAAAKVQVMRHEVVVLEMIAKRLPVADLRTLRGTCPIWNQAFTPSLRLATSVKVLQCPSSFRPVAVGVI